MVTIRIIISKFLILFTLMLLVLGCSNHEIDTVEEWCEQISGMDLEEKHKPFWAVFIAISINVNAIRDNYVDIIDTAYSEEVGYKTDHMAWRKGADLHLENLSTHMEIKPEEYISEWREGLERAKKFDYTEESDHIEDIDRCIFGTVATLFDNVYIHSREWDEYKLNIIKDNVTKIDMERKKILTNPL